MNYPLDKPVYVVLEEDGTEVDEEEYFQTLPGEDLPKSSFVSRANAIDTMQNQFGACQKWKS